MACTSFVARSMLVLCVSLCSVAAARATTTPTWVSATGKDSAACTLVAPCATFQIALSKTTAGGTIFVANSGSYGPIRITKSVSIIAPAGVEATIYLGPGQAIDGINVSPGAGNTVLLKGLTVVDNNADSGFFADIEVDSGHVSIEDCTLTTGNWGIYATNPDFLLIRNNRIENTQRGVENHTGVSTIFLDGNNITLNSYALIGNVNSYGNNTMNGNTLCDVCESTITKTTYDQ